MKTGGSWWDGARVASTLTVRSNCQLMPDKDNFGAIVQRVM